MKNHAFLLCVCVFILATVSTLSATNLLTIGNNNRLPADTGSIVHYSGSPLRMNEIKIRAARHFEKKYHVGNEKWYKLDDGFVAVFGEHSNINRAYYDGQGRFQFTIKNFEEKDMPGAIRKMVKDRYLGYNIFLVTEIISDEKTIFQVHLKDEHSVKTIQVWDNQMRLIEDLINAEI
jgi:hypothetical protein